MKTESRIPWVLLVAMSALTLVLVVVFVGWLSARTGAAAQAQPAPEESALNTITVVGVGQASAAPDVAYVQMGILAVGPEVGPTVEQANGVMRAVMQALAEQGVAEEQMQTSGFNLWSEEQFEPRPMEPGVAPASIQYRVENSLSVTVSDVDRLSGVIQSALDAGANRIWSVSFGVEDTDELERRARTQAIENARARAADLAEKMGLTLGAPVTITEGFGAAGYPVLQSSGVGKGGGPPISSGEMTLGVQLNVTFRIEG